MFKVRLQNFDSVPTEHDTYQKALQAARHVCFETLVYHSSPDTETVLVASYSPLYGLRVHNHKLAGMEPGLTMADAVAINGIPVK